MANLMQIYVISQFGCGIGNRFPREMPTKEKSRQFQYVLWILILFKNILNIGCKFYN
jgi:hypothetical protein